MDNKTKEAVQQLNTTYGPDAVREAAGELLAAKFAAHTVELAPTAEEALGKLGDRLLEAAKTFERANYKPQGMPVEYLAVLSPESLLHTIDQINAVAGEVLAKGAARQSVYADRRDLVKRSAELETEIKLVEADSFMEIQGVGKDQFVEIGGKKTPLTNDTARDAYRRMTSRKQREEKAKIDGNINALEIDYRKANDDYEAAVEMSKLITAKAHVQASLLTFLSTRGA